MSRVKELLCKWTKLYLMVRLFSKDTNGYEIYCSGKDIDVTKDNCIECITTRTLKHGFIRIIDQLVYLFNVF